VTAEAETSGSEVEAAPAAEAEPVTAEARAAEADGADGSQTLAELADDAGPAEVNGETSIAEAAESDMPAVEAPVSPANPVVQPPAFGQGPSQYAGE
jgi:hypothetical protein